MAKAENDSIKALSLPAGEMLQLTLVTNEILGDEASVNSYQVRNARALAKAKTLVLYRNGVTKLPVSVKRLQSDALAKGDHSLALAGNIQLARGESRLRGRTRITLFRAPTGLQGNPARFSLIGALASTMLTTECFCRLRRMPTLPDWRMRMPTLRFTPSSTMQQLHPGL